MARDILAIYLRQLAVYEAAGDTERVEIQKRLIAKLKALNPKEQG